MIDKEVVKKIADLAKIEVEDEESLAVELSRIISYVDKLKEVDSGAANCSLDAKNIRPQEPARQDQAKRHPARETILKNAPDLEDDLFKMPKIIK